MRFKTIRLLTLGLVLTLCSAPDQASALSAREIMEKVDAREDGDNMIADLEMILIDKSGHKRFRKLRSFTKDKGEDTQRLMFFLEPADVKDTGFLTYDYYEGFKDDDQWLYLPELKKTKRIASSDKSSSFMGTDFSYADMTRRVLDEWNYKILKEDQVRGKKVWLIETSPVDKKVEDRYGYTKSVVFVRQDIFFVVRAVSWVKEGRKLKYFDVRELEKIDGIWVGTKLHMKTVKNKRTLHQTEFNFNRIKFNQEVQEDLFTIRRLEKGM